MWIKLHSSITEWEWFTKPEMLQVFILLLTKASYKDKTYQGTLIRRGQLITTIDEIHVRAKLSVQQIRTCLKRLQSSGEISLKSTNKNTLITICNYDRYQVEENDLTQTDNKQTTNGQQTNNKPYIYTEYTEYTDNNSLYNAHARESVIPPDLEDCFNMLAADRAWQESVLINLHARGYRQMFFEQLMEYLKIFFGKLKAEGSDFKHPRGAKQHFLNWVLIQLEKQKNEINRSNNPSRKQEANDYLLSKFVTEYSDMDEQVPNPFSG